MTRKEDAEQAHVERMESPVAELVRMKLQVLSEMNDVLEKLAEDTRTNKADVIRQALALMKVAHEARLRGKHIGLVSDPERLDMEIVGLL